MKLKRQLSLLRMVRAECCAVVGLGLFLVGGVSAGFDIDDQVN